MLLFTDFEFKHNPSLENVIEGERPSLPNVQGIHDKSLADSTSIPMYPIIGAILLMAVVIVPVIYLIIKGTRRKQHRALLLRARGEHSQ